MEKLILSLFILSNLTFSDNYEQNIHYNNKEGINTFEIKDYRKARILFAKGCIYKDAYSCTYLGLMYDKALGIKQDYDKAIKLYNKGCQLGDSIACFNLGNMHQLGDGVKKDSLKAIKFYAKGCNGGDALSCYEAGNMYKMADGIKQNYTEAKELYEKSCKLNFKNGCNDYFALKHKGY